jgi:hypothetical protein
MLICARADPIARTGDTLKLRRERMTASGAICQAADGSGIRDR